MKKSLSDVMGFFSSSTNPSKNDESDQTRKQNLLRQQNEYRFKNLHTSYLALKNSLKFNEESQRRT